MMYCICTKRICQLVTRMCFEIELMQAAVTGSFRERAKLSY